MRILQTQSLEAFLVIADSGSLRQAAEILHLAPSTLSAEMRALEAEVGVSLFQRSGRSLTLTMAGREWLAIAREQLDHLHEGLDAIRELAAKATRLCLASSPMVATGPLPGILRRLCERHPDLELRVLVEGSDNLEALVASGTADLAISRLPATGPGLASAKLSDENVRLAIRHPGGDHDATQPALRDILPDHLLLTHTHPGYWPRLLPALRRRHLLGRSMRVERTDVARRLVEEGLGVSLLPFGATRASQLAGRILTIDASELPVPHVGSHLIWSLTRPHRLQPELLTIARAAFSPWNSERTRSPAAR